jgi:hypothetical protein
VYGTTGSGKRIFLGFPNHNFLHVVGDGGLGPTPHIENSDLVTILFSDGGEVSEAKGWI